MKDKIELLAPAGDLERAYFALEYGADAVYFGAKQYSLRARASNFDFEEIQKLVNHAHKMNKKVYLVTNVICHNFLLKDFDKFFSKVVELGIDAFIVADPFIFYNLKKKFPNVEIHISTQQSITNSMSAKFWKRNGATRVVLAREMKFDELELLCKNVSDEVEIEAFIHGAVCISYSGRCMMSNNFSLRDANVGGCAQSCRWEYKIEKSDIKNYFTMSAKDMVYLTHLDELSKLNIKSFKIEGRMKTINYLTTVVKSYRKALDEIYENGKIVNKQKIQNELDSVANRQTGNSFLFGDSHDKMLYHDIKKTLTQNFLFMFTKKIDNKTYEIISKNYFELNTPLEILCPHEETVITKFIKIQDLEGNPLKVIRTPMTRCIVTFETEQNFNEYCIGKEYYEQ